MPRERRKMGDLLLAAGVVTQEQLQEALDEQKATSELLGQLLVRKGLVTEHAICEVLHQQLGLPVVRLEGLEIDEHALSLVSEELASRYLALPLALEGQRGGRAQALTVAMADPLNARAIEDIRFYSGHFVRPVLAPASEIAESITHYYHLDTSMNEVLDRIASEEEIGDVKRIDTPGEPEAIDELIKESNGRPIVRLTNWLLTKAVNERASDIHIEPQEREIILRYRIDGLLQEIARLPKWAQAAIVSRIKVLANLDIAEKRQPQDGHFKVEIAQRPIELRVSTLPVTYGEKVVIRIVDQYRKPADIQTLGLNEKDLDDVRRLISRPQGIILVTGPTGSGKSTTLYSFLRHLYSETTNIVTVEDPVENQLPGINQCQVDEKAKKTFASALRAILRQDPDVIMIGEIRDAETAQIAFRASITGHLVFSTVHTNDAPSAVTRLIDVGLQPFMVASSLLAVMSMRLVRTICPKCREPYALEPARARQLGLQVSSEEPVIAYKGSGCAHCRNTGYFGRTGLFELLEINDDIRELINQGAPDSTIRLAAIDLGMKTLVEDGLEKVLEGQTTLDEVSRVVYVAEENRRLCPYCSTVLAGEFDYCPSCGHFVGDSCVQCHRRLNSHWSYCPFCGTTNRAHRLESRNVPGVARIEGRLPEIKPSEVEEPPARRPVPEKAERAEKADKTDKAESAASEARKMAADALLGAPPARGTAKPPKAA
ncbi:MAG TPA: ATPase, T2SS/T4P/T4SS family [Candidatus Eisenbacteria bacterium]|nr:ATPase, T2SS/T4P/T4SS family [Candidatus Eisenbacteria bacterium]